jgi:hypothetical protein
MLHIPELRRLALLAMFCIAAGDVQAQQRTPAAAKPFADSPCFKLRGATATADCERIAGNIAHDIAAVRWLGRELEQQQRFPEAGFAYETGLKTHPDHRDLLQGLIRARKGARAAALLEPPPPATAVKAVLAQSPPANVERKPSSAAVAVKTSVAARPLPTAAPRASLPGSLPTSILSTAPSSVAPVVSAKPPAPTAIALLPAPVPAPTAAPSFGRYRALIIGNEHYKDFDKLRSPLADAKAIAEVLRTTYGFEVQVLANATRYELLSAFSKLRKESTESDNVLIYYAGHGHVDDVTGRGYWLPVDAEHDNVANWLSTSDIADTLSGLKAKHSMIIADSCFSGALLRGQITVLIDERQSLLKKVAANRSRTIMTSGGLEPVMDSGAEKHSVFAAALLDALRGNGEVIEAARLFVQIRDRVAASVPQTPQYAPLQGAGHQGGDFIFVPQQARASSGNR